MSGAGLLVRLDRVQQHWRRRAAEPRSRRRLLLALLGGLTLLAGALRLWRLDEPGVLVFDETYYVKDAWSLLHLGYEGAWPRGDAVDSAFAAGATDGFSAEGAFVVHPPLGKWLIALGMLFAGDGPSGWRLAAALLGTLLVPLTAVVMLQLRRSLLLAALAGLLLAVDGQAIAMSRVALLDGPLAVLVLLGFAAFLRDRSQHAAWLRCLAERSAVGRAERSRSGGGSMLHWRRPWLVAAGMVLGAAAAVKWSALWYLAALGLAAVVGDLLARRRLGLDRPWSAALGQGAAAFLLLVPAALAAHLAAWSGWFATAGGWSRHWAGATGDGTGPLTAIAQSLQSWLHYQGQVLQFHTGLAGEHPYASPAWQWPLLLRPTLLHFERDPDALGCGAEGCDTVIWALPNPLLWWGGVAAALWLAVRLLRGRAAAAGPVLLGIAAGWLPWLALPERTAYHFYAIVLLPFLVLAFASALGAIRGRGDDPPARRQAGIGTVAAVVLVLLLVSAWWYPLVGAAPVPTWFYGVHRWLPAW